MLGGDTGAPATGRAAPNPFGKVSQLQQEDEELQDDQILDCSVLSVKWTGTCSVHLFRRNKYPTVFRLLRTISRVNAIFVFTGSHYH